MDTMIINLTYIIIISFMAWNKDIYIILDNYNITYYNKLYNTLI